jgi:hypothetical protein
MYKNSTLKRGAERLVKGVETRLSKGKVETTYTMKENGNGSQMEAEAAAENRDELLIEQALKNLQAEAAAEKGKKKTKLHIDLKIYMSIYSIQF